MLHLFCWSLSNVLQIFCSVLLFDWSLYSFTLHSDILYKTSFGWKRFWNVIFFRTIVFMVYACAIVLSVRIYAQNSIQCIFLLKTSVQMLNLCNHNHKKGDDYGYDVMYSINLKTAQPTFLYPFNPFLFLCLFLNLIKKKCVWR